MLDQSSDVNINPVDDVFVSTTLCMGAICNAGETWIIMLGKSTNQHCLVWLDLVNVCFFPRQIAWVLNLTTSRSLAAMFLLALNGISIYREI